MAAAATVDVIVMSEILFSRFLGFLNQILMQESDLELKKIKLMIYLANTSPQTRCDTRSVF